MPAHLILLEPFAVGIRSLGNGHFLAFQYSLVGYLYQADGLVYLAVEILNRGVCLDDIVTLTGNHDSLRYYLLTAQTNLQPEIVGGSFVALVHYLVERLLAVQHH